MKKILFILLLFSSKSYCQTVLPTDTTGKVIYTGVVDVAGKNKAALYSSAREWVAVNYKSAKDVIQLEDKENGKLVLKCSTKQFYVKVMLSEMPGGFVNYSVAIDVKDEKYRYTITDFYYDAPAPSNCEVRNKNTNSMYLTGNNYERLKKLCQDEATGIIASLEKAMPVKTTSGDW